MAVIVTLSTEQDELFEQWLEEWHWRGTSTERSDRPRAEHAISEMYATIGESRPSFHWFDSPLSATMAIKLARSRARKPWSGDDDDVVRDGISFDDGIRAALQRPFQGLLRGGLRDRATSAPWDEITERDRRAKAVPTDQRLRNRWHGPHGLVDYVYDEDHPVYSQIRDEFSGGLYDILRAAARDRAGESYVQYCQVRDHLYDRLGGTLGVWERPYSAGAQEALWVGFFRYCQAILGVHYPREASRRLGLWESLVSSCFWVWAYRGVCVISERPTTYRTFELDSRRRPSETATVMEFADGYAVTAWHDERHLIDDEFFESVRRGRVRMMYEHRLRCHLGSYPASS